MFTFAGTHVTFANTPLIGHFENWKMRIHGTIAVNLNFYCVDIFQNTVLSIFKKMKFMLSTKVLVMSRKILGELNVIFMLNFHTYKLYALKNVKMI